MHTVLIVLALALSAWAARPFINEPDTGYVSSNLERPDNYRMIPTNSDHTIPAAPHKSLTSFKLPNIPRPRLPQRPAARPQGHLVSPRLRLRRAELPE